MATYQKKSTAEKADAQPSMSLNDPEVRARFKSQIVMLTQYLDQIDKIKEGMRESVSEIASEYGIDKRTINRLAKTMFKHNYTTLLEENRHFETLYEMAIEGRLRDDIEVDPLDRN